VDKNVEGVAVANDAQRRVSRQEQPLPFHQCPRAVPSKNDQKYQYIKNEFQLELSVQQERVSVRNISKVRASSVRSISTPRTSFSKKCQSERVQQERVSGRNASAVRASSARTSFGKKCQHSQSEFKKNEFQ
jgi:hypothetical protein